MQEIQFLRPVSKNQYAEAQGRTPGRSMNNHPTFMTSCEHLLGCDGACSPTPKSLPYAMASAPPTLLQRLCLGLLCYRTPTPLMRQPPY